MRHVLETITSNNLAARQRTVAGLLRSFGILNIGKPRAAEIFSHVGLPLRALNEPDFSISLDSELAAYTSALSGLGKRQSATTLLFKRRDCFGLETLGVVGMAMRHAATAREALKVLLQFPGMTWGHTRLTIRASHDSVVHAYVMSHPGLSAENSPEEARLIEFCTVMDMVSATRNHEDLIGLARSPISLSLPFDKPWDWSTIATDLPYPVYFNSDAATIIYPASDGNVPLPKANPLTCQVFLSAAKRLSLQPVDNGTLGARVTRWLWARCPPMGRSEVARQLNCSERSLTRGLAREGTSFAKLLLSIQIERAQGFLSNSRLSVQEVSSRMGYSDPAAFSRAFSGWTGHAPTSWRKKWSTGAESQSLLNRAER